MPSDLENRLRDLTRQARSMAIDQGSLSGLWDAVHDAEDYLEGLPTMHFGRRRDTEAVQGLIDHIRIYPGFPKGPSNAE